MDKNIDQVIEQFNRVKRWHKRLEKIYKAKNDIQEPEDGKDIAYAFFQNCFHLKDWIIKSSALNKNIVNNFINSNKDMKICRDLCNASKHFIIENPSIDKKTNINKCEFYTSMNNSIPKKEIYYLIHSKDIVVDALELAGNCVLLWNVFLNKNSIELK